MTYQLVFSQLFNGLIYGMLLALISSGLTIIYGSLGVVNFAHGALLVFGAYTGYVAYQWVASFWLSLLVASLCTFALGLLLERFIIRRFYDRPPEDQILVTFGLSIIIVELIRLTFGGIGLSVVTPSWGTGAVNIMGLIYPKYRLYIFLIAASTLFVLYLLLYRSKIGLIIRAGIEDSEMVEVLGIRVSMVFFLVFGLGALFTGYAGFVQAPINTLIPDMGFRILVLSFVVVVIGGVGSFPGAILGGILAGEILSITAIFDSTYADVMLYLGMAMVLVFRPQGLMGQVGRE